VTLVPGTVFAGYTIEATLGVGGMGTVYLARHPRLPRSDALKLLRPELSYDPDFAVRFAREADIAARLSHPNIVGVNDRGAQDGQLWISMPFHRRDAFRQVLRPRRLRESWPRAAVTI
jgi:serine/threonine-protein kinase